MTSILPMDSVRETARILSNARKVVILTHIAPDGDAMGSSLGLMHYLQSLGSAASVSIIVPTLYPDFLAWMPQADTVVVYEKDAALSNHLLQDADAVICTDFNEPKRIGGLGGCLLAVLQTRHTPCILIDHHLHPADFADVVFSYPESPSSCELVYRLICDLSQLAGYPLFNRPLNLPAATCLYTGMMTDTGNFSFNSNRADMYEIVSGLVRVGVNKDAVYNSVFNAWSADRMRLVGYCLYKKMIIIPEYHAALIFLTRKELYRFNFRSGDAEGIVNMPLQIRDICYSCFMREDKVMPADIPFAGGSRRKVKISMRSQGDRPVNEFCHSVFNGGGHMNASGGEFYGPIEQAVELFMQNYAKFFLKE
ncbi:MAG: DHH family phosphoesterase [Paludibacteraceae bacterium]|nr:DHH family phosphoesterase [Paludibacteraceae bacterium]